MLCFILFRLVGPSSSLRSPFLLSLTMSFISVTNFPKTRICVCIYLVFFLFSFVSVVSLLLLSFFPLFTLALSLSAVATFPGSCKMPRVVFLNLFPTVHVSVCSFTSFVYVFLLGFPLSPFSLPIDSIVTHFLIHQFF